ncbi:MAG: virulence factor [Pseudomonadota bacterium]
MPDVTIVYWRDIPAQIKVGRGRRAAKAALPERFEQAIDRCAMRAQATDSDAYTAEFRMAEPFALEGEPQAVADAEAARIAAEYTPERVKALIDNSGWDAP